ncbi:exendin-3-like isoform 1-T2 [Menidia menidia]
MFSKQASTTPLSREIKFPKGDLRMKLIMWCVVVVFLCSRTKEMVMDKTTSSRWESYQIEKGENFIRHLKRHSDGTFANDLTNYFDKKKAKDFVEWLTNIKREGCREELLEIAAEA